MKQQSEEIIRKKVHLRGFQKSVPLMMKFMRERRLRIGPDFHLAGITPGLCDPWLPPWVNLMQYRFLDHGLWFRDIDTNIPRLIIGHPYMTTLADVRKELDEFVKREARGPAYYDGSMGKLRVTQLPVSWYSGENSNGFVLEPEGTLFAQNMRQWTKLKQAALAARETTGA